MSWNDLDMKSRSDLMELYLKYGITSLDAMKEHYNSFATGGQTNVQDEPNFVGGATALKKDYNYELEHLADKYAVTANGPWHDYGIHNPSTSQRAHWNKLSKMYNRVAQRSNYEYLNPVNILEYTPVVGDAIDAAYSIDDISNGNIGIGLAGLSMLAMPNIIEKPLRKIIKKPVPLVNKNTVSTYWDRFSNRVKQKYGDDALRKIDFIQSNTAEDKLIASNILEKKAEALSKETHIGTKQDWLNIMSKKSTDSWFFATWYIYNKYKTSYLYDK